VLLREEPTEAALADPVRRDDAGAGSDF